MRPSQLSLTAAFVLFTVAQWRDCQAGHLGLRQSALPSGDDVTRSISKTSKGGLAATQGGRQSLERVQNLLDRTNGKFLLGVTKDVKNNIATGDGQQKGGAGEERGSDGNTGKAEDKDELTDDITVGTNQDDVTEAHYPADDVTEAHYPSDDVTEAHYPADDVTEAHYPADDVTEAHYPNDGVTESHYPYDDITNDNVTDAYNADGDVTESYNPDNDVTKTQNPVDDVTEEGWTEDTLTIDHTESPDQFDDVTDEPSQSESSTVSFDSPEMTTETYDVFTDSYDIMDDVTESSYQYYDVTESLDVTTLSAEVSLTENPTEEGENVDKQEEGRDDSEEESEKEENMEELKMIGKEVEIKVTGSEEDDIIEETEREGDEEAAKEGTEAEEEGEKETKANSEAEEHVKERRRGKAKKWLPPRFQLIDNETDEEDDLKKKKKKSHLDEALKKKMHDSHGFLVGRPDVEMEDEVEDLKILEAVVTSMAEWEFNQLQKKLNGKRRVKRDEEVVCYKDLGCFRDEGPFDYLDMLPSPPEEINSRFLLYTRERPDREKLITYQNITTLIDSTFNASRPTKMLIHGFGSSCYSVWIREMRVALLTMMDVNIICVNWQKGAEVPNYVRAASNTRLVGRQVAVLIETMNAYLNTTLDDFHLIGFSLGAHVSGHAGARLKNLSRISGLDPAGPLFESYSPSVRLDFTDAKMVDVIHTNADSLLMGGLGAFEPMGHVDFYPNGGRVQKGCANLFVGGVSDILWPTEGDGRYLCNHRRGYKYYLDSIAPICKFPSFVCRDFESFVRGDCFPCEKCGNMGYFADKAEGRGQLYLVTRDTEPFCANQYKVTVRHSGGPPADPVTTYGRIDITFIAPDGINETLQLTRSEDEAMEAGGKTMRILVPHPAISEVTGVQLRYTAYKGWIYSGFSRWAIDQIVLMDSFGKTLSFCNRGTTLVSEKVMQFSLLPGECPAREVPHGPPITPWPLGDTRPEHAGGGDEKHKESENEVRHVPGLRLAVAQRVEPRKNVTQNVSQGTFNHTRVVPGPVDAFPSVPLAPDGGEGLLSITLEVPPNYQEIPQGLYTTSLAHQLQKPRQPQQPRLPPRLGPPSALADHVRLAGPPGRRVTLPPKASEDVAVSSEDPVSVIPAPDLANRPHNLTSFMHPPPPLSGVTGKPPLPQASNPTAVAAAEKKKNSQSKFQVFVTLPTTSAQSLSTTSDPEQVSQTEAIVDVTTVSDSPQRVIFTTGGTLGSTFSTRASNPFLATSTEIEQLITGISPSPATGTEPPAGGSSVAGTEASHLITPPGTLGSASKSPWPASSTSGPILTSPTSTDKPEKNLEKPQVIDVTQQFTKHIEGINGFQQEGFGFHPLDRYPSAFHTGPGLGEDIPGPVDYNSVIDGEIPVRERARALTLGPLPASVLSREQSVAEEKRDCQDPSCLDSGSGPGRPGPSQTAQNRESVSYGAAYSSSHPRPVWSNQPPTGDSPRRTFPLPADAPPRLPSPGHGGPLRVPPVRSPPMETIVGRGRALQPLLLPHRSDHAHQGQPQQRHQTSPQQQQLHRQQFSGQPQQQQHRPPAQQQSHASPSHDQDNQPSRQHLVSVSAGNVTQIGPEISERSQHPVPAPAPYYVQILPPSFSQLPHLETFSIPREHRKSQQESRKRVGVSGRSNRGRSLSGIGVPPPGGRAAVFTPLLLQLQDDHRGRYIPLRPLPDPPVLT